MMALMIIGFTVPDEQADTVSRELRGGILRHELAQTLCDWVVTEASDVKDVTPDIREQFTCEVQYDSTRDPNYPRKT